MNTKPYIVICSPGVTFTHGYLRSFIKTQSLLSEYQIEFRNGKSSDVTIARNRCLYDPEEHGNKPDIKPFDGQPYDYMLWIDSDMVWEPEHIKQLIERDVDFVTGFYPISTEGVTNCGWEFGKRSARIYINQVTTEFFTVDWCGLGFALIKRGVFEKVGYPWFQSYTMELHDGTRMTRSEDVSFCARVRDKNIPVYADTRVRIGHQKQVLLRFGEDE